MQQAGPDQQPAEISASFSTGLSRLCVRLQAQEAGFLSAPETSDVKQDADCRLCRADGWKGLALSTVQLTLEIKTAANKMGENDLCSQCFGGGRVWH